MTKDIGDWRDQITKIDKEIIDLLEARFSLVCKIGEFKKKNNISVRDEDRESVLVKTISNSTSLSSDFVANFYELIFNYSYTIEK